MNKHKAKSPTFNSSEISISIPMPGIAHLARCEQINLDSSHAKIQSLSVEGSTLQIGLVLESNLQAPRTPTIMPLLQTTTKVIRLHCLKSFWLCFESAITKVCSTENSVGKVGSINVAKLQHSASQISTNKTGICKIRLLEIKVAKV